MNPLDNDETLVVLPQTNHLSTLDAGIAVSQRPAKGKQVRRPPKTNAAVHTPKTTKTKASA